MDVRNCRMCGKLYNYIGGAYRGLCPNCIKVMEDKFIEVKEFINDNGKQRCLRYQRHVM